MPEIFMMDEQFITTLYYNFILQMMVKRKKTIMVYTGIVLCKSWLNFDLCSLCPDATDYQIYTM